MSVRIITSGTKVKKENNCNTSLKMISSGGLVKKNNLNKPNLSNERLVVVGEEKKKKTKKRQT